MIVFAVAGLLALGLVAASGIVVVRRLAADGRGSHRIKASGVNIDSGGSCEGSVTY